MRTREGQKSTGAVQGKSAQGNRAGELPIAAGAGSVPTLELKNANGSTLIGNDDWEDDPTQAAEIQQRMLAPTNPRESALVATLAPGQYTAIVSGKGGATGVAVVEGYALQ